MSGPGSSSYFSSSSSYSPLPTDTKQLISCWEETYVSFLRLQDVPELALLIQDLTALQECFRAVQETNTSPRQLPRDELRNIWQTINDCERLLESFKTPKGPRWDAFGDDDTRYAIEYLRRRALDHVEMLREGSTQPNPFDMRDISSTIHRSSLTSSVPTSNAPYPYPNPTTHRSLFHTADSTPSTAPSTAPLSTFTRRSGKSTNATAMSPRISVNMDGFQLPDPALSPSTFTPLNMSEMIDWENQGGQGSSSNPGGGGWQQP